MANPTAAMVVIGDEILSGRTRDANMFHLAQELTKIGIDLKEVRVVSDEGPDIIAAINGLRNRYNHVFTSGGIGPTHDDITADNVAAAFDVPISIRADARQIMAQNYPNGEADLTPARLRMARIPEGADLISNPISFAPGFSLENVYVMAGVPKIFVAMLENVLPTITCGKPLVSETVCLNIPESTIAGPLGALAEEFPGVSIGSYPFSNADGFGSNIVIRGSDKSLVSQVSRRVETAFEAYGK